MHAGAAAERDRICLRSVAARGSCLEVLPVAGWLPRRPPAGLSAIAAARASRPAAGAAVAAASPTCELLSVSGPDAITASTETFTAHIFSRALSQVSSYPAMTAMPAASVMLAGTGAADDPSSRTRRTHSSSCSSHQPLPSEAVRSATALRARSQADVHAVWSSASSEPAATPSERCVVEGAAVRTGKK